MKRVAATTAFVRSWLPSVWKRVLQRLLQLLLGLTMLPRRLLLTNGDGNNSATKRRRWLRIADADETSPSQWLNATSEVANDAELLPLAHTPASGRAGLPNTGNTCFVNAVVQCLVAIPGFTARLEEEVMRAEADESAGDQDNKEERSRREKQLRLAVALLDLLQGLCPEDDPSESVLDHEQDVSAGESLVAESTPQQEMAHGNAVSSDASPLDVMTAHIRSSSKKRKRVMSTDPSDFGPTGTRNRLRCFLQAASKCTELVVEPPKHQDQQDAEELLLFILDALHDLLRSRSNRLAHASTANSLPQLAADKTPRLIELNRLVELEDKCLEYLKKSVVTEPATYKDAVCYLSDIRWQRYLMENRSFITDMFTGQIVRGSQCCSCANLTCLHQEFRVLSLSINASTKTSTIDECLDTHRRLEDLIEENKVFCDGHCKDKTSRRTQVLVQSAPQTLVIQLQRFKHAMWRASPEKIDAVVHFPISTTLNMTANMFTRDTARPVVYELQAVCSHIGGALDAGHYIAYARDRSTRDDKVEDASKPLEALRWLKYDDDYVTVLDEESLRRETQSTAYMLFYTRVEENEDLAEPDPQQSPQREASDDAQDDNT